MSEFTHITPRYPPQIDGLGDYARLLARELRRGAGIEGRFVVGDPVWRDPNGPAEFPIQVVQRRSAAGLAAQLDGREVIVLHYVGYGYQSRGVPMWLVGGLEQWKKAKQSRRLVVVFHELWSSGPPWRSEFFLHPLQRWLVIRLLRACDAAMTSTLTMARMLEAIEPGKTAFQPIANSLPAIAPTGRAWHAGGAVRVAFFGQEATRLASVEAHLALVRALHDKGLLKGIDVVGRGACAGPSPSADVRRLCDCVPAETVDVAGNVSAEEGARRLARADLFLSSYRSDLACKSSALTAALACGCLPVLPEARNAAPLAEGRELLACDGSPEAVARLVERIGRESLAPLAQEGLGWIARHASWQTTARRIAELARGKSILPESFNGG